MKSLGATIADLNRQSQHVRVLTRAAFALSSPTEPEHLQELTRFGSNPGDLRAWVSLPESPRPGAPLIVALHGCNQCADDYDRDLGWSRLAGEIGAAVLFPEQRPANNRRMCFNWFLERDVASEGGEAESIRQMVRALIGRGPLAASRVFVTGLSAGGAMAAALLALYPEDFAAGAVIAGMPVGSASSPLEALEAMSQGAVRAADLAKLTPSQGRRRWPRVAIWQGGADDVVHPANGETLLAQWLAAHGLARDDCERVDGPASRRLWRDRWGSTLVEHVLVPGLGHGAPIDGRRPREDAPGPYALDVGLDSTRRIAQFWGLLRPAEALRRPSPAQAIGGARRRLIEALASFGRAGRRGGPSGGARED